MIIIIMVINRICGICYAIGKDSIHHFMITYITIDNVEKL